MLQMQVVGHLGKDAEKKIFKQGEYISFSVAHTQTWTDQQSGQKQSKTTWIDCLKKDNGSKLIDYLKKGTQVLLQGEPKVNAYIKENKAIASQCMNVHTLELLNSGQSRNTQAKIQHISEEPEPIRGGDESDLPF